MCKITLASIRKMMATKEKNAAKLPCGAPRYSSPKVEQKVVDYIDENKTATVAQLAEYSGASVSTINNAVLSLSQKGKVKLSKELRGRAYVNIISEI